MTRVLNLLDQPTGTGETLTLRLSRDAASLKPTQGDEQHAWLLLGGEPMRDAARLAGLPPHRVRLLPKPAGVRRWVSGAQRSIHRWLDRADRVDCWTADAAALAGRLGCNHFVPRFGQATLCGFAKSVIDRARRNTPPLREGPGAGHASSLSNDAARSALRERWGVDDDTTVVALLTDRPECADAGEALLATAFTFEALAAANAPSDDARLLCHPRVPRRLDAAILAELLRRPQLLMQDAGLLTPWRTLAGCDLALAPDPRSAGLSILWANAMGLPVITPPEPCLPALADCQHRIEARSTAAKHLAHPMTRWIGSRQPAAASGESRSDNSRWDGRPARHE